MASETMDTNPSYHPGEGAQRPPRVSIGLPVYNGGAFLVDSIDSILAQSYEDFELIIADNASTDETERVCQERESRDDRVRYFRHPENMGPVYNFNFVVGKARGEYFKWAAHDDMHEPTCVARCVEILDAHQGVVLAHPRTRDVDESGEVLQRKHFDLDLNAESGPRRFSQITRQDYTIESLFGLMRTEMIRGTRLLGKYADCDRVLLAEIGLAGRIYEIHEYLFVHRQHGNRSVARYKSRQTRTAWFDPSKEGKPAFPYTREFLGFLAAVRRSNLSLAEKARCNVHMAGWALRNASSLAEDVTYAIRYLLRPLKHRLVGAPGGPNGGAN